MHRNSRPTNASLRLAIDGSFLALPASGIGTYVRLLHDALLRNADALGIDVQLITPGPGRWLHPGTKQHRFAWDAFGVAAAWRGLDRPRPSLLHLPQMSAPIVPPAPMVVTIHDVIPFILPEYRASSAMRLYLNLMRKTTRRARQVLVPSHAAAADVARVLDIPPSRITVTPEAADPTLVPARNDEPARAVARQFGLTGPYLFNIGGLDVRKNVPLLIHAFADALPQLPGSARLVIAGAAHSDNPIVFPPLQPIIAERGVGDRVLLTGRVSDHDRRLLYQAARAYITPSTYEGFGLTPLEAMACGAPPIIANRTSLPEVVGDAGLTVEPTRDDLAAAIVALMTDDALRRELARRSLARAQTFTWDATAAATVAAYRAALTSGASQ